MGPADKGGAVDWSAALESTGNDPQLLQELIEVFLDEGPMLLRAIRSALENQDAAVLRRSAHTLKGSLRIFGVTQGVELAQEIENRGKQQVWDGTADHCREMETFMATVLAELKAHIHR